MSITRTDILTYQSVKEQLENTAKAIAEHFRQDILNGRGGDYGFEYASFEVEDGKFTITFEKTYRNDPEVLYAYMSWSIDHLLDKSVEEMVAIGKEQLVKDAKQEESEDRAQKAREENLEKARRKQQFDRLKAEFEGSV